MRLRKELAVELVVVGTLFGALGPFVVLSFFVHPQNDDWAYAVRAQDAGFWGANVFWYEHWGGRYSANAILSASPLAFGWIGAYRWLPVLVLALLGVAAFAVASSVAPRALLRWRVWLAAIIVALFLAGMPDVAQGIYWWTGAVSYQLGLVLWLGLVAVVLALPRRHTRLGRVLALGLAFVLVTAAAGTNELVLAYTIGFLVGVGAMRSWRARRLEIGVLVLAGVAFAVGSAAVLAPGNQMRLAATARPDIAAALSAAVAEAGRYLAVWTLATPVLPVTALLWPAFATAARRHADVPRHPALVVALVLGVCTVSFVPSFVAAGAIQPRTLNVVYLLFVIGMVFTAWTHASRYVAQHDADARLPIGVAMIAALFVAVTAFRPHANLRVAWSDLLSGSAARYNRELDARYEAIAHCRGPVCMVPRLSALPPTIAFFDDAVDDSVDDDFLRVYKASSYAYYFGKQWVGVAPTSDRGR